MWTPVMSVMSVGTKYVSKVIYVMSNQLALSWSTRCIGITAWRWTADRLQEYDQTLPLWSPSHSDAYLTLIIDSHLIIIQRRNLTLIQRPRNQSCLELWMSRWLDLSDGRRRCHVYMCTCVIVTQPLKLAAIFRLVNAANGFGTYSSSHASQHAAGKI